MKWFYLVLAFVMVGCAVEVTVPDGRECEIAEDCIDDENPCTAHRCTIDGECLTIPIGQCTP